MISVVIPLYNKAHTIVNTLNSVLQQIYQNFEIIIVNDGSTDNSVEIIKQHFVDDRIRIINQKNAGVSVARNRGVEEAQSEYIAFLDGDDEWHPEYLYTMHKIIIKYPKAGLYLCAGLIHNADESISYRIASKYEGKTCIINLFENPEVFSHTSATIIHKDSFNRTHRFIVGMRKFEDYLLTQAISLISDTVYCGIPLTKYNGGIEGQLTQQNLHNTHIAESEVLYFNTIMNDYLSTTRSNKLCPIHIRYILRHTFKVMLLNKDYEKINYYMNSLSSACIELLSNVEIFLVKKKMRKLALLWINITKIRWRMYGFPFVGQKIKTYKINSKYLNW